MRFQWPLGYKDTVTTNTVKSKSFYLQMGEMRSTNIILLKNKRAGVRMQLNFLPTSYSINTLTHPSTEKAMVPHSSTLAWKIPWMEEPGGIQSMGSLRVEHDWGTSLSLSCIGEGNGHPLQCSCLENPRDRGAWWAAIYGVAQSWTRLKQLSSSSSSIHPISWMLTEWTLSPFCPQV